MTLPIRIVLWSSLLGIAVLPLALVVSLGFGANHLPLLLDGGIVQAAVNSVTTSFAAAVGAVVIGTMMAFLLDRTDLAGRRPLKLLLLTPLFVPPFIGAIAWTGLVTRGGLIDRTVGFAPWDFYGFSGVAFLLTLHAYPVAYFVVAAALRRIPADLVEA
ncbi:MAG: iron ABC transporter permease, partial [Dietzia cercidiphylli]